MYVTYLSALLTRGHGHVWISKEIYPRIGIVLYHMDMMGPPVEEFVIKGLLGPFPTLSRQ
jgi:hypothetical protein